LNPSSNQLENNLTADVEAVAFHEAGHAVVALALGCVIHHVAITPRCGEQWLGELRVTYSKDKIRAATQRTMVPLGGSIAQIRAFPNSPRGDDVDLRIAHDAAVYLASNPRRFIEMMQLRTRKLIDRHWGAVEVVADALISRRRLSDKELAEILC
jgi:ATP-dependent Zn protease